MNVETADELRVLATEPNRLPLADRALIKRAAEELETTNRALVAARTELALSLSRRAALTERVVESERRYPLQAYALHVGWRFARWRS